MLKGLYPKLQSVQKLFSLLFMVSLFLIFLTSCGPSRNIVYFSDLPSSEELKTPIKNNAEPKIQENDILEIVVNSLNPESNALFNNGVMQVGANSTVSNSSSIGYIVQADGTINFPVIGKLKLAGLTKSEAVEKITTTLKDHLKNPIVNLKFLNFKVTVVGEVNRPSSFTIPNERINIIEAIGMAGDLTVYGRRENVLLIRETNGIRTATRLNLNNKAVLDSPYFYLKQNDVLYIEPDHSKVALTDLRRRNFQFAVSITASILSVVAIVLTRFL